MLKNGVHRLGQLLSSRAHNYAFLFYTVIFSLVVLFLLTTTLMAHIKNRKLEDHYQKINQELTEMRQENQRLQQEISAVTNDPIYLEMCLRRDLKLSGAGEIVIQKQ